MDKKKILFVRSGGGMPGIDIHAGIWAALEQEGVVATHCSGTSAGAIVSAMDAVGYSASRAVAIVRNLKDSDIRSEVPAWKVRIPWINYFLRNDPIRAVLEGLIPFPMQAAREKELMIWAQHQLTAEPRDLMTLPGNMLIDAVLASMAISGVFPPVKINDDHFVDGGGAVYLPVPRDLSPYDEVWLLVAAGEPADYKKSTGILTHMMRNIDFLIRAQLDRTIQDAMAAAPGKVRLVWPRLRRAGGSLRFDHGLLDEAFIYTRNRAKALKAGGQP